MDIFVSQDDVAKVIQKYDLTVVPVVDMKNTLIGVITVDDIVDVVVDEATQDLYKLSGTSGYDESKVLLGRSIYSILSRLPWLLLTLVGGSIAAFIITKFSQYFDSKLFALSVSLSFVPLLMGLAGNVGNQSSTIIVRGISTGVLEKKSVFQIILRELGIGTIMGCVLSIVVFCWLNF